MLKTFKEIARIIKHKDYKNWNNISGINNDVLIVGNGPSLKKIDINLLNNQGAEICCVNSFAAENKEFFNIKPKYYCAIDPDIFSKSPMDPIGNKKLFDALERVEWDIVFLCYRNQKLPINNPYITYSYLPLTQDMEIPKTYFLYRHNLSSFRFQNVINACLYYFISARVKTILLVGIETDWHRELIVDENNIVYRKKLHFYGEHLENVTESGLIGKGELYKYFEYYAITLKCFYLASRYADEMGVRVINFTTNSYVDCFEKMNYKQYLLEKNNES